MIAAAVGVLTALFTRRAEAQPATAVVAPVELTWLAPAECPTDAYVIGQIESAALAAARAAGVHLVARVVITNPGVGAWHVDLSTGGTEGHRVFDTESCGAAADATALILSLAMTQRAPVPVAPADPGVSRRPSASASPAPSPRAPKPLAPTSAGPSDRPPRFGLGVGVMADSSLLPAPAVGGEATVAWFSGPLRLELAGSFVAPQTVTAPTDAREGAHLQLLGVAARGAWSWPLGDFSLGPIVGLHGESLIASGFGGTASFERGAFWAELAAGGIGTWSLFPWVALRVTAMGALPLSRPSVVVLDPAPSVLELHRVPAITARGLLAVEVRFL